MTYFDGIWYVGGSRAGGAHAEFWAWHMLIKYLICIMYSKIGILFVWSISWESYAFLFDDIWYVGGSRVGGVHANF